MFDENSSALKLYQSLEPSTGLYRINRVAILVRTKFESRRDYWVFYDVSSGFC
jgi:hypothetical protein